VLLLDAVGAEEQRNGVCVELTGEEQWAVAPALELVDILGKRSPALGTVELDGGERCHGGLLRT
jgi:hypothetical protein